jgi:Uma2 family endonuclease
MAETSPVPPTPHLLSEAEYVDIELTALDRHEYVDGVVRAMSGTSKRHNEIALNIATSLRAAARANGCQVYMEGVRLRATAKRHYYPDVMVTCSPDDDSHVESSPCLIVEVLSPTTQAIDRGEKRIAYFAMPTLRRYLMVDQEVGLVEHFERTDSNGPWTVQIAVSGDTIVLGCPPDAELRVDDLFGIG